MQSLLRAVLLGACLLSPAAAGSQPALERRQSVLETHRGAIENPNNEAAFEAFLRTLPSVTTPERRTYYVIEGDLLLTADEVRVHLATVGARNRRSDYTPELIVNLQDNRPDFWESRERRRLSYAVERKSFASEAQYARVVANMAKAVADWVEACSDCGISFEHRSEQDSEPTLEKVTFIVRALDAQGRYIAAAFFPSSPGFRRYLNIDTSYFSTSFDQVGVLRHELGHVLGYRHEHTREVRGCYYEDDQWKPLTDYDPKSVMHYFCGGAGSTELRLTDLDKKGHRALYATVAPAKPVGLIVRLEGGEIAENITQVAKVLARQGALDTQDYTVRPGDSVCTIYMRSMEFPSKVKCPEKSMLDLHAMLNGQSRASRTGLTVGRIVKVPANIGLRPYQYTRSYDSGAKTESAKFAEERSKWNVIEVSDSKGVSKNRIRFEGYEIRLPLADAATASRVTRSLAELGSANIYTDVTTRGLGGLPLNSLVHPLTYLQVCRQGAGGSPGEADYAQLLGASPMPQCALQCTGPDCAQVFIIDKRVAPNPDLRGAFASGVDFGAVAAPATRPSCVETAFKQEHHGTHLAGIIASQPNGFGFVGLSPGAKLHAVDRESQTDTSLADLVQEEMDDGTSASSKIFVYAGLFSPYEETYVNPATRRLNKPELRFTRSQAAARIKGNKPLWITAAGQAGSGGTPIELFADSAMAPMNLGDLNNVLVVSACEDCSDRSAKLLPEANYSDRIVSIAAPGKGIAGHADSSAIAVADGTSQATAFVAGVAAAMKNCYPTAWSDAERIKRRLMITARPAFGEDDYAKTQSGVVDADLALRDPTKNWIKTVGNELVEASIAGWCQASVTLREFFLDLTRASESFPVRDIRRITRYSRGAPGAPAQWVVFGQAPVAEPWGVTRSKPGRALDDRAKLLKLSDSRVISLGEIEELLLTHVNSKVVSCN